MLPKVGLSSGISSPPPTDSRPSPQPLHLGTPGSLDGVGGGHRDLLNFRGLLCDSISQLPSDPRGPWRLSTAAPHVLLGNLRACGFQMPPGPEGQRPSREPPAQPQGLGCCGDGWQEGWGQKWGFVQGLHSLVEPPPPPVPRTERPPACCSPQGNKGVSLTVSGSTWKPRRGVGPAGDSCRFGLSASFPCSGQSILVCALGSQPSLMFGPWGSDCDCPLPWSCEGMWHALWLFLATWTCFPV